MQPKPNLRARSLQQGTGKIYIQNEKPECLERVEILEDQECVAVDRAIDQLAGRAVMTPFQRCEWTNSWQRWTGDPQDKRRIDVVGYRAGIPVLILPLSVYSRRGFRHIAWRADDLNDYCGPIADPEILRLISQSEARQLLRQTAKAIGGADVAYLQKQPKQYGAVPNPFVGAASVKYHANAYATRLEKVWEKYYQSKRSAKTRRRLKEKFKALSKLGNVSIRFSEEPEEAASLVARCLDMKAVQLRQRGHWNHLSSSGAKAHVTGYFAGHCKGATWVAALLLDETPIAISFGFRDPEMWLLYQIAMNDGAHSSLSPGTQLLMFIMQRCCELGVKTFDFSLGDEAYKQDWCEENKALMTDIYPLSARGFLASVTLRLTANIHNFIASRPALYERAKNFKNWLKTKLPS